MPLQNRPVILGVCGNTQHAAWLYALQEQLKNKYAITLSANLGSALKLIRALARNRVRLASVVLVVADDDLEVKNARSFQETTHKGLLIKILANGGAEVENLGEQSNTFANPAEFVLWLDSFLTTEH